MPAMTPAGRDRLELKDWEDGVEVFAAGGVEPGIPDGSDSPLGKG